MIYRVSALISQLKNKYAVCVTKIQTLCFFGLLLDSV